MVVIDADGHVEESVAMFGGIEKDYYDRRPLALQFERDTAYGRYNAVWLIDGEVYPRVVGKNGITLGTPTLMERASLKPASSPAQERTHEPAPLRDLDQAGMDQQ